MQDEEQTTKRSPIEALRKLEYLLYQITIRFWNFMFSRISEDTDFMSADMLFAYYYLMCLGKALSGPGP